MEFFTKAVSLIFSLSILVVLHELGHFIPAKLFKTKVEKFYLFFDPWFSLVKKKIGDTVYGIGWLPLGGYVKIAGMVDESMDKEQMKQPPKSWEFRSKKTWQRLIIMVGGVTVNALLAWFIYSMSLLTWGEDRLPNANLKYGIATTEIARDHGFRNGDIPISINGEKFDFFSDFTKELLLNDKEKEIVVLRDGEEFTFKLYDEFGDHALDSGIHRVIAIRIPFIVDSIPPISETIESTPAQGLLRRNDQIIGMNGLATPFNNDISKNISNFKTPNTNEIKIFNDLISRLQKMKDETDAEIIQTEIYQIGKDYEFENLRDWFKLIYQVLFGKDDGPRFGTFVAIYGIEKTIKLIESRLT
jgi:regulator of sigma E protease